METILSCSGHQLGHQLWARGRHPPLLLYSVAKSNTQATDIRPFSSPHHLARKSWMIILPFPSPISQTLVSTCFHGVVYLDAVCLRGHCYFQFCAWQDMQEKEHVGDSLYNYCSCSLSVPFKHSTMTILPRSSCRDSRWILSGFHLLLVIYIGLRLELSPEYFHRSLQTTL